MVSAAAASALPLSFSLSLGRSGAPAALSLIQMLLTAAAIEKKLLADNVGKTRRRRS